MKYIGIDVSKAKLDLALLDAGGNVLEQVVVSNTPQALHGRLTRWMRQRGLAPDDCLACFEPTGHYSYNVLRTLLDLRVPAWMAQIGRAHV